MGLYAEGCRASKAEAWIRGSQSGKFLTHGMNGVSYSARSDDLKTGRDYAIFAALYTKKLEVRDRILNPVEKGVNALRQAEFIPETPMCILSSTALEV